MKRFAPVVAVALLLFAAQNSLAANKFHMGGPGKARGFAGAKTKAGGAVNFEIAGGAGEDPRFFIGGTSTRFDRVGRRKAASGSFPVAVAPGGYGYGGSCGHFFGDGGFSNLYNQGFIPVPPYFALHPPVYYSVPVPRTYGYSPFPYPGAFRTPEFVIAEPEVIDNPHIEPDAPVEPAQEASTKTASLKTETVPLVVRNPFVKQPAVTLTAAGETSGR